VKVIALAVGFFARDFVAVFHFLDLMPLTVHTAVNPMFAFHAFMVVLRAGRLGPGQSPDGQGGGESGGGNYSKRHLGHDCILQ
jgi:hypothetical protein